MKFLGSSKLINEEMSRLIKKYKTGSWAVAWASINFDCYKIFSAHKMKFEKIIIGTHFYQTHPNFIKDVIGEPNIRFDMNPGGVFHPKLYLFENDPKEWECIIGSPNFTQYAFEYNSETAMLISNKDIESDNAYKEIKKVIGDYWKKSKKISKDDLTKYQKMWERKQKPLKKLSGRYDDLDKSHKSPLDIEIITMTWEEYISKISKDKYYQERIKLISSARDLFRKHGHFKDIGDDGRDKLAGLVGTGISDDGLDWWLFGTMTRAWQFNHAIKDNNIHISQALDFIPFTGEITKTDYDLYYEEFKKVFPNGGYNTPTVTRLLAMKRPDYFLCLNKKNWDKFSDEFGIARDIRPDNYWDAIVERIIDCEWWNSDKPTKKEEEIVWAGRAAFLDGHLYEE
ncbi:MAG: NgoFVII family restriction endonuclease [Candidatus Methanoperedens sp.]|nr:NgoFVII family restriction endonuclease [Candidatus Methanoperedens sp.]